MQTNPVIAALLERRTCRSFTDKQLSDETINTILEAGRYAATALGIQPQRFIVVQNAQVLTKLVDAAKRFFGQMQDERSRQRAADPSYDTYYAAPTVIFTISEASAKFGEVDCANSMQNMALAAHSLGVGSCYIASCRMAFMGDDAAEMAKLLGIPEGYRVHFALALGYPAGPAAAAAARKDNVSWVR